MSITRNSPQFKKPSASSAKTWVMMTAIEDQRVWSRLIIHMQDTDEASARIRLICLHIALFLLINWGMWSTKDVISSILAVRTLIPFKLGHSEIFACCMLAELVAISGGTIVWETTGILRLLLMRNKSAFHIYFSQTLEKFCNSTSRETRHPDFENNNWREFFTFPCFSPDVSPNRTIF